MNEFMNLPRVPVLAETGTLIRQWWEALREHMVGLTELNVTRTLSGVGHLTFVTATVDKVGSTYRSEIAMPICSTSIQCASPDTETTEEQEDNKAK